MGRLAPHKRPDLVLRAFGLYRELCDPGAELVMVGTPLSPSYLDGLRSAAPAGVTFTGAVSRERLEAEYGRAAVLLSLSEHEGFWIPLLEAFDFEVPVVARPVGGMPWVGGDAVLWADTDDLVVVAHLMALATELRAELVERGRGRLDDFAWDATAAKVRRMLGL